MKIKKTNLDGVIVIENKAFQDLRGSFTETFNSQEFIKAGINNTFHQDNESISKKNVLRGLHYQDPKPQGKLVRCVRGAVLDVAVDINPLSKNFCKYFMIELSEKNNLQLFIPEGYAHGFLSLEDDTCFQYKCTTAYSPSTQKGILWNDPTIKIDWPIDNPLLSEKDQCLPTIEMSFKN